MGGGGGGGGGGSNDCDACIFSVGNEESLYPKTAAAPENQLDGLHGRAITNTIIKLTAGLIEPESLIQ